MSTSHLTRLSLIVPMLLLCFNAYAKDDVPTPKSKTTSLKTVQQRLKSETMGKEELLAKIKKINTKLSSTKNHMVNLAQNILSSENDLKSFEQRISTLELKESILQDKLTQDKTSISKLILALERIERTPPEAMLASPNTPYKMAQSALLMGDILPSISKHATKLRRNLETLQTVKSELQEQTIALTNETEQYKKQQHDLGELIETRQKLYEKTNADLKSQEILIQKFSLQAKNLSDLIEKIEKENRQEKERHAKNITKLPKVNRAIKKSSKMQLPISGIVRIGYKQKDDIGSKSNGLKIEGRSGALVVAPLNGIVQFTGTFKRYGKIIIIEHADGFHSLISGIEKINVSTGSKVNSGEPIAELPNSSFNPRPTLYYELRKNGKPTNPSILFSDLG